MVEEIEMGGEQKPVYMECAMKFESTRRDGAFEEKRTLQFDGYATQELIGEFFGYAKEWR